MLDNSEWDVSAFMSFLKDRRVYIHSTNPLKRLISEWDA